MCIIEKIIVRIKKYIHKFRPRFSKSYLPERACRSVMYECIIPCFCTFNSTGVINPTVENIILGLNFFFH